MSNRVDQADSQYLLASWTLCASVCNLLPPDCRTPCSAVCYPELSTTVLQDLLTDSVLHVLLHEDWHTLDLAGPSRLTPGGVMQALQRLPLLEVLDISRHAPVTGLRA